LAALAALLPAGCGDGQPRLEVGREVSSPAGSEGYAAGGAGSNKVSPDFTILELFRIGSASGDVETSTFGRILDVEVDQEGNIYVLDGLAACVRAFRPDGTYLRTIGGPGEGPGEFRRPNGLVIASDGHIWVSDTQNNRFTAFDLDGALAGTQPRDFLTGWGWYWDAVAVGEGMIYEPTTIRNPQSGAVERTYLGLRLTGDGIQPIDTIPRPPEMEPTRWAVGRTATAGGPVESGFVAVPFTPVVRDHLDPREGYWVGTTNVLRFVHLSFEGDTIQIIEDPGAQPRPVTGSERRRAIDVLRDRFGDVLRVEEGEIPEIMPFWEDFFVDAGGYLWFQHYRPLGMQFEDARRWTVFGPEGKRVGGFDLPLESAPTPVLGNDRLVGTVRDSLGVEFVVVFEIGVGGS